MSKETRAEEKAKKAAQKATQKAEEKAQKAAQKAQKEAERQQKKLDMVEAYAKLAQQFGQVTMSDMKDAGYTKDMVSHHFGSLAKINKEAREHYSECFFDAQISDVLSGQTSDILDVLATKKRFIITTVVTGCRAHKEFLASMETYCKKKNAHILLIIASDPAHNRFSPGSKYGSIDKDFINSDYVTIVPHDINLNSNIAISTLKVSAKQIDPAQSMCRVASRFGSFIFASPKQRLKMIPQNNASIPKCVMTTGAASYADYSTTNYMSGRTGWIAQHDHVIGGVVVEVEDDKIFHFRQIQGAVDGSFNDLGFMYSANGSVKKEAPEAFILGDWHSGSTSPMAKTAWKTISKDLKIKKLIMHDFFDGYSINHHIKDNVVVQAQMAMDGQNDLASEMRGLVDDINELSTWVDELIVVKSNHDDFLNRYLQTGKFMQDSINTRYAAELVVPYIDGFDPLEYAVNQIGLKKPKAITWLKLDESYMIANIELGMHGHNGTGGSRGSINSMEIGYGDSVSGHSHTPQILRGAFCVGTSTHLQLDYNKGPSSWFNTSCLLYKNGQRQLINVVDGKWTLDD